MVRSSISQSSLGSDTKILANKFDNGKLSINDAQHHNGQHSNSLHKNSERHTNYAVCLEIFDAVVKYRLCRPCLKAQKANIY
jgi:hypothetical protein